MLQTMMSSHGSRGDEVIKRKGIKGMECTPRTLYGLVDCFGQRIGHIRIIVSGPGVLDVVLRLELLEALHVSIVDILGVGNELGRRRSVGSRHFVWRTG